MGDRNLLLPLTDLPGTTQDLARSTLQAGYRLLSRSAAGLRSGSAAPQTLLAIGRSQLKLRFYLVRQREEVHFFFVKKQHPDLRPLEAQLRVILQATPGPSAADVPEQRAVWETPAAETALRYRLLIPPFLILVPTAEQLARYAPPGTTAANGILLRAGPGEQYVLGIRNPESEQHAAAVYTSSTRQPLDSWRAEPFLALIETLRVWLVDGMQATEEVGLELPADASTASDVRATIYYFIKAYQSLVTEAVQAPAASLSPPLAAFAPRYEVADYTADIGLCVDRNGSFASAAERQPVSVGLRLSIGRELGQPVVRIILSPPDFLIAGVLRDAFLGQLRNSAPQGLLQALGLQQGSAWADFLDSAAERAVVFRTGRSKEDDTDAVVLPGIWEGGLRTVLLRTTATVSLNVQPVRVKLSALALVYDSQASREMLLDSQTVTYFMRLVLAFKVWQSLVR